MIKEMGGGSCLSKMRKLQERNYYNVSGVGSSPPKRPTEFALPRNASSRCYRMKSFHVWLGNGTNPAPWRCYAAIMRRSIFGSGPSPLWPHLRVLSQKTYSNYY